jgi:alpha-ribazole phosphatase
MSEILFIRHAETDMAGTFCGSSDPELNARGREQLDELISGLSTEKIAGVFASDLRRAHMTGKAIAEAFNLDCNVRPALREIDFGQWEGLTWKEIEQRDKNYAQRWLSEYPNLPAPDGEHFRDFVQRVLEEVKSLLNEAGAENRCIAVVTHAGVLRVVLSSLQGWPVKEAWDKTRYYCSIVRHPIAASPARQMIEVRS